MRNVGFRGVAGAAGCEFTLLERRSFMDAIIENRGCVSVYGHC
jgi:hypothetical protein